MLDKTDGTICESKPKDAGWQRCLYTIDSIDGLHDGFVEAIFGLAENYASPSLDRLLAPDETHTFTDGDRGNLAYLIAAQEQRVPGALEELRRDLAISGSAFAAVELANLQGTARKRRQGLDGYEALVAGRVSLEPSPEAVLKTAMIALARTARTIFMLPWTLLRARQDAGTFVSSDRPLTMFDPTPPHAWAAPGWMSSENVAATIPLSSSACLRVSPRDRRPLTVRTTTKQVERINRFTYGFADRYVYGGSRSDLEALHGWAQAAPHEVPTPIPKRLVLLEDLGTADSAVADANEARGWDRYLMVRQPDGGERPMSYEVIDSLEDAMKAISPRETKA